MSDKLRFGEILVRAGVLERDVLQEALEQIPPNTDLGELLIARGHLDEGTLLQTIGRALNLPSVRLCDVQPEQRALDLVPREDCAEYFLLPIHVEKGRTGAHLHVAMANPTDVRAIKRVTRKARLRIRPLVGLANEIRVGIAKHYGGDPIPGLLDKSEPPAEIAAPPVKKEAGVFDFGITDLGHLDSPEGASPPPPIASAPRSTSRSPLPIGDDLLNVLDEFAVSAISPRAEFDRAKVAAVRRTGPPREIRASTPAGPILPRPVQTSVPRRLSAAPHRVSSQPFDPGPPLPSSPALPLGTVPTPAHGLNISRILDRYSESVDESEVESDEVIADALNRYGPEPKVSGEAIFAALDRALVRTRSMGGRLTVVLIRQLARRGLVDSDELLKDLKNVTR